MTAMRPHYDSGDAPTKTYVPLPPATTKKAPAPRKAAAPKKAPAPRKAAAPRKATTTKKAAAPSSSNSSNSSSSVKKSSDKQQVAALEQLLNSGFAKARDQRLANIDTAYKQGDSILLAGYDSRIKSLLDMREDNEKAEGASSWANQSNRAREAGDILAEIASQGAGETDQMQANLIAARNWAANQLEVGRAFQDSQASSNNTIVDLNADVRSARYNLANQAGNDREQAWANFSNQMADTATQLGNIYANPYSDSHKADTKSMWDKMNKAVTEVWKNPGVDAGITQWSGTAQPKQVRLNDSLLGEGQPSIPAPRRPEGSTLRRRSASSSGPGAPADPVGISGPGGPTGFGPGGPASGSVLSQPFDPELSGAKLKRDNQWGN